MDLGVKIIIGSGANHTMTECFKSKLKNIHPRPISYAQTALKFFLLPYTADRDIHRY